MIYLSGKESYWLEYICSEFIYFLKSFKKSFFVKDDYEEERQTNLSAVIASLQLWERKNIVSIYGGFEAE